MKANTSEDLLAAMTLEEKVAQMFVVSFFGNPINEPARALLAAWQPGAVVLLPSNIGDPQQTTQMTNDIQQILTDSGGIPALIMVDQEGGIIARLQEGFTAWPVPALLTATQDTELAQEVGAAFATELRAVGINMNLAPVADLNTNPANPIIGRRSFGSDGQLVAPIVGAFVRGMQEGGVLATAKHFPGHGDTSEDSHLGLPVLSYSEDELLSRELVPFRAVMDAGVSAVMVAHIAYPQISQSESEAASLSQAIVTDLLRDTMGYRGLAITDALDMDAIDTALTPEDSAIAAIQAGHDLILTGAHVGPQIHERVLQAVVDAVRAGIISEARIERSVQRILQAKIAYGLLDWQALDPLTASERIPLREHAQLISEMFRKGVTVVGESSLPLSQNSLMLYPATRPTLWNACRDFGWQGIGFSTFPTDADIQSAQAGAATADQIVVITRNVAQNLQLAQLIAALPSEKTTVIALHSPYDLWHLPPTAGYMVAYSPLANGYEPLCEILSGVVPAQGRLAIDLNR